MTVILEKKEERTLEYYGFDIGVDQKKDMLELGIQVADKKGNLKQLKLPALVRLAIDEFIAKYKELEEMGDYYEKEFQRSNT